MRILIDQAEYSMSNQGNIAMLQIAVNRLRTFWPDATFEIISQRSQPLRLHVPNSRQVYPYIHAIAKKWLMVERFYGFIPRPALKLSLELLKVVSHQWKIIKPSLQSFWFRRPTSYYFPGYEDQKIKGTSMENNMSYMEITNDVDLLVATGGQYLTDMVRYLGFCVLGRLDLAIKQGIPTVLVGQGIGPIEDPELFARAREVLPKVDLILIREKKYAPELLASLGVSMERVYVTGDDAIEMAYEARTESFGKDIGINMRAAYYTEVNENHLDTIQQTLSEVAHKYDARLTSVPISHYEFELDDQVIQRISTGQSKPWFGLHAFDFPLETIKKVRNCRLVVTGGYHPAVFALAQGIPAVCLAKSKTYAIKFLGLADIFGSGCQVVFLDNEHLNEKLSDAIDFAWQSAEITRPKLLEAAARQIEWGHIGYKRIYDIVLSRNRSQNL